MFSLMLPIFVLLVTSSQRTTHLLVVCLVSLSNMGSLFVQPLMLSGSGEPNLSFYSCRWIVYLSTLSKPTGLYLTLLFSIERLVTKILPKMMLRANGYQQLVKRFHSCLILTGMIFILSLRAHETLQLIPRNASTSASRARNDPVETNRTMTEKTITFRSCYRSMNVETYAELLSFYTMQYWFEYVLFTLIVLVFVGIVVQQARCCCPPRSSCRSSVNTTLYLSLSSCVIFFESILLLLHSFIVVVDNNNTTTQVNALQAMLFVCNIRCMLLPWIVCLGTCQPFQQWLHELLVTRPFQESIDETDHRSTMTDGSDPFV